MSAVVAVLLLVSCGGYKSPTTQTTATSLIKNRVLVTNGFGSVIRILDGDKDAISITQITTGSNPQLMLGIPGQIVVTFDAGDNGLSLIDPVKEEQVTRVGLPGASDSIALSPDGKFAYAAIRNAGAVAVVDIINRTVTSISGIPAARRLVLSKTGAKLLVFSDDSDAITVINTSDKTFKTATGFDRAYSGVFADDSKAYILSCGAECGGIASTGTVSAFDIANSVITGSVSVGGATVGLLDGANLYVAGSNFGAGTVDTLSASALTVTKSVAIADGLHSKMAITTGKLFVGSSNCTQTATAGCLSILDVAAQTAKIGPAQGSVSAILPVKNRTVVYTIEGGNLRIYDIASGNLQAKQLDLQGALTDMIGID